MRCLFLYIALYLNITGWCGRVLSSNIYVAIVILTQNGMWVASEKASMSSSRDQEEINAAVASITQLSGSSPLGTQCDLMTASWSSRFACVLIARAVVIDYEELDSFSSKSAANKRRST